ncbi:hypothetical protein SAMN05421856_103491 [Chryseobacterium taichungense]|uniref:Lipoprotein n=1 Tax=Chryseobacterium taichungense TaxID=295069 RepID=A0A1H7YR13_9FLAO|nr:hypothetical protein [Chryseobacterium taichungense]SEM48686.1 hypothetical protein SAMN05421856_103491 [Chryseobacterium taichungense]
MIKNNISSSCLVAAIMMVACKKDQHNNHKNIKDSAVHSQNVGDSMKSVQKTHPVKKDSANNEYQNNDKATISSSKKTVDGTFVASNCDGGRFSIEFKNSDGKPSFKILDKKKIIAAGNVSSETDEKTGEITTVVMGEIAGLYDGDKIVIQNYGNSMNEFDHFTQCGDKYLEFIRQK